MGVDKANAIINFPNTQQSLQYHHALAGLPPKETFLAAVRAGNYGTWPGLTTTLILKHFSKLDKTQKGHMKGQQKGVRSTKVRAPVTIKKEPGTENPPPPTIKKHYDIFVVVYKLLDMAHTDQTGTLLMTSQQGYWYIMVGIHLDANYTFCELIKNKKKGEMITAYYKEYGMPGDGPCQTQEPTNLGPPRRHRLQHWDGDGASPIFPRLHCENQGNKS